MLSLILRPGAAAMALLLLSYATLASADPAGRYDVSGLNADGGAYAGVMEIRGPAPVYEVLWRIAGETFTGVGIYDGRTLSVAYYGGFEGVVAYVETSPGSWTGRWAVRGAADVGAETLVRAD